MVTKNHKHSMSQPERAFWRDVFVRSLNPWRNINDATRIQHAADIADASVAEYRKRVTWRQQS